MDILNSSLTKSVNIEYEGRIYICKIDIKNEELININIYLDNRLKYKGNICLEKIQIKIKTFLDYNINEIFEEINKLNNNNFIIIKENNKYKLKIKFIILRRKKYLYINLNENNINNNKDYYENIIKKKNCIILELKEKIKLLEEKFNNKNDKINQINNNNLDKNVLINYYLDKYNISLKNQIHTLNYHTDWISCLSVLNDGRLISGSADSSIIIYNKITYKPDLIIKEHKDGVWCITQLSSGIIATCSSDKTIKLFNIKKNNYNILQTLNYHTNDVYKIIELKNKYLVSCSIDKSIIFYLKDNNKYKKDYQISTKGQCFCINEIKENEICYSELINDFNNNNICFYDINERKIKSSISNISKSDFSPLIIISKELLFIPGKNKISIIDINYYELIREIKVPNSGWIYGACMLNENIIFTGDNKSIIREWKIEGDNLILISKKEKAHNDDILTLLNIGNGYIASGSADKLIKIW